MQDAVKVPDVNAAVSDGRRRLADRLAGLVFPTQLAVGEPNRDQFAGRRTDVNDAAEDGRTGVEPFAAFPRPGELRLSANGGGRKTGERRRPPEMRPRFGRGASDCPLHPQHCRRQSRQRQHRKEVTSSHRHDRNHEGTKKTKARRSLSRHGDCQKERVLCSRRVFVSSFVSFVPSWFLSTSGRLVSGRWRPARASRAGCGS